MDAPSDPLAQVGTHIDRSDVLHKMAKPDIYQVNAFRVLGLPVTASPKEISAHVRKLDLSEKFGSGGSTHNSILPPSVLPDGDARRRAQQRLQDPELRFIDEFFWFWPLAPDLPEEKDEALAAMTRGDLSRASGVWEGHETLGSESNVSVHNLAVLYHLRALDLERLEVERTPSREEVEVKRSYWEKAFGRWQILVHDDGFWERVWARVHGLNDPRLTVATLRRIREGLPAALLSINAMLAVEAADMNDPMDAIYHLRLMRHPGYDDAVINEALNRAVMPVRDRVRAMAAHAREESGKQPENDCQVGRDLLDLASPQLQILDLVLSDGSATRDSARDEVALQARSCSISYCTQTEDWNTTLELLEQAAAIAASGSVLERLREDIEAVRSHLRYSMCWFCKEARADEGSMATVKMYGNVRRGISKVAWQKLDVPVPRCKQCKSAHDRRRMLTYGGVALGVILAIVVGIAASSPMQGFIVFAALAIVGYVAALLSFPREIDQESYKEQFPGVSELTSSGWRIGEKPEGVQ